jgi:L-ascorbate metabolism protein UlaG (beta-lactamase superfamily)
MTWLGHSAFLFESKGTRILVDPWLKNPKFPGLPMGIRPDLIVVTHGHQDHLGDTVELAREHGCPVLAVPELTAYCERQGCSTMRFNHGGTVEFGGARIRCVDALHSSSVGPERDFAGDPCGVVLSADGINIYHAGDTDVFGDMQLIGDSVAIDLALLPIGGLFTMDSVGAVRAVELLRPARVAAMHYGTFAGIEQDPDAFGREVERRTSSKYLSLQPGVTVDLEALGTT